MDPIHFFGGLANSKLAQLTPNLFHGLFKNPIVFQGPYASNAHGFGLVGLIHISWNGFGLN